MHSDGEGGPQPRDDGPGGRSTLDHLLREVLTRVHGGQDFTEEDEAIVVALAAAAGVAIENARLYEEAAQRQEWLAATAEITGVLADPVADAALQIIADRARAVAGADVAWVVPGRPAGPACWRWSPARRWMATPCSGCRWRTRGRPGGAHGQAVAVEDLAADPRADRPVVARRLAAARAGDRRPAARPRGVEGVLTLAWTPERGRSDAVDPALPASFAEQAALALQVARARADQQRLTVFEDRDRIGRDLHDLVIQRLFAVGLGLESASRDSARGDGAASASGRRRPRRDDQGHPPDDLRAGVAGRLGRRPDRV